MRLPFFIVRIQIKQCHYEHSLEPIRLITATIVSPCTHITQPRPAKMCFRLFINRVLEKWAPDTGSAGILLNYLRHESGRHGTATLTDVEALTRVQTQRVQGLAHHLNVITGHRHLARFVLDRVWPIQSHGFV